MFGLCYLTDTNCLDFIRLYRKGNLAVFDFNRLAVGLFQTVAAFCRMEGKVPVQGDICQAVLALIHTHNGTIAILGAFDGFQHHIGCIQSGKAEAFARLSALHSQRGLVQEERLRHRAGCLPFFGVRINGVCEMVNFLIRGRIRLNAGLDQGQPNHRILDGMTVLAVVQHTDAVMSFAQVHPLLTAAFKACAIPAGVGVRLAGQVAVLDFKRSFVSMDIYREVNLQQALVFVPVHGCNKLNPALLCIEMDILHQGGVAVIAFDVQCGAHGTVLRPCEVLQVGDIPELFGIENIDIPVVIIDGLILIYAEEVACLTGLEHFAAVLFVKDAGHLTVFIKGDSIERGVNLMSIGRNFKRRSRNLCRYDRKRFAALGRQVVQERHGTIGCFLYGIDIAGFVLQSLCLAITQFNHIAADKAGSVVHGNAFPGGGQCIQALLAQCRDFGFHLGILFFGDFVYFVDGGTGQNIMELIDEDAEARYPALSETVQDNLMLYAEHTWGHSSTITNPYDTMVLNLDMRKNSYASKAHEAASLMLCSIAEKKGDMLRYYNTTGAVRAVGVSHTSQPQLIEFYIETLALEDVEVRDLAGNLYTCQVSPHPRGRKISFIDTLSYGEEKEYIYTARHKAPETLNTRHCYMGAEEVRDIVNDYDPVTYRLPYEVENKFFRICYKPGDGITSFVDKRTGTEMAGTAIPFFTPVYQRTPLHQEVPFSSYEERRALGRNIRGKHAETHIGKLMEITCMEHGPVFTQLRLHYSLAGTVKADVLLKLYEAIPRIDFTLELGKTISDEVESVFLSLDLNRPGNGTVLRKGAREAFRPGIDQLPGTCMEFYMSDDGAARLSPEGGVLIAARDVPMFYTGEMQHHPIRLCDGAAENNARPLYSWVMNNNWETNFKMDLSGFCQYDYSLWLTDISDPEQAMDELHEQLFDPYVLIVR